MLKEEIRPRSLSLSLSVRVQIFSFLNERYQIASVEMEKCPGLCSCWEMKTGVKSHEPPHKTREETVTSQK